MNEVRRLRAARTLFDRAQADNVSMQEARRRIHAERHDALAAKLGRTASIGLCGTAAPIADGSTTAQPQYWWQRHD